MSKEVVWQMSGNTSKDTKIDENGKLTIGKDETAQEIKVKAVSKENADKYGEAVVTVKREAGKNPGTKPSKPSKPSGSNKNPSSSSVKTGDETQIVLWGVVGLLAAGTILVLITRKKKHH